MLDYYNQPGVRDTCHMVKQVYDRAAHAWAVEEIAKYLSPLVSAGDILIPAPSHEGYAGYTKEIAEVIAINTGGIVKDILKSTPHIPRYMDREVEFEMLVTEPIPKGNLWFVDNVISTGYTFKKASELIKGIKPLVYAIDRCKCEYDIERI